MINMVPRSCLVLAALFIPLVLTNDNSEECREMLENIQNDIVKKFCDKNDGFSADVISCVCGMPTEVKEIFEKCLNGYKFTEEDLQKESDKYCDESLSNRELTKEEKEAQMCMKQNEEEIEKALHKVPEDRKKEMMDKCMGVTEVFMQQDWISVIKKCFQAKE